MKDNSTPNPGSDEALDLGCKCPIIDNNHGRFPVMGEDGYWINEACPIHSGWIEWDTLPEH